MTRTPLSRSQGQRSRSPGRFTHRCVGASGDCSGGRENVMAVRNCCYVAVCSAEVAHRAVSTTLTADDITDDCRNSPRHVIGMQVSRPARKALQRWEPGQKRLRWTVAHNMEWKNRSERCKHCALAVVRLSQKFSPRRRPPSRERGTANI